ncbi:hypothetical protein ACUXV3_05910 [Roseobacteraceae bacterium NS-SX3]
MTSDNLYPVLREYHRMRQAHFRSEEALRFQLSQFTGLSELARSGNALGGAQGWNEAPEQAFEKYGTICRAVSDLQKSALELAAARAGLAPGRPPGR